MANSDMYLYVLDRNFQIVYLLDQVQSLIWTDRFQEAGDFEIYTPVSIELIQALQKDRYLYNRQSEHMMIIDEVNITTDTELGKTLKVTGMSLEYLLERRIIWSMVQLNGNFQTQFKNKVLEPNLLNPTDQKRKMNFLYETSTDPEITELQIEQQYTGYTLYELLVDILANSNVGFKVVLNSDNKFVLSFYSGVDRSYSNADGNTYVVFSPDFENLIDSNYYDSNRGLKNAALVAGEDPNVLGNQTGTRRTYEVSGSETGLDRREMFVDARDIQSEDDDRNKIPDAEYDKLLKARGEKKLAENGTTTMFDADVDTANMYVYGRDFFLGDLCQLKNEFGIEYRTRISEIIFSWNTTDGYSIVPTFVIEEDEEDE